MAAMLGLIEIKLELICEFWSSILFLSIAPGLDASMKLCLSTLSFLIVVDK